MKKLIFLFIFAFLLQAANFGQEIKNQVIGTAGNLDTLDAFVVSWTLGEVVSEKFTDPDCILTQGFQQSWFTITTAIQEYQEIDWQVSCYPNPATNFVNVKVSGSEPEANYLILLTDINGRQLYSRELEATEVEKINLTSFNTSMLFLKVVHVSSKTEQYFKIVKFNPNN